VVGGTTSGHSDDTMGQTGSLTEVEKTGRSRLPVIPSGCLTRPETTNLERLGTRVCYLLMALSGTHQPNRQDRALDGFDARLGW